MLVTARQLGIPVWELDSVPMMYQNLAYSSWIAEEEAKKEYDLQLAKIQAGQVRL